MKKHKFNEGGLPDYEREPDEQDRKMQETAVAEYTDRKEKEAIMSKPLAKASFKEAFADARAAGDKTFEYMGKKYSTEMSKPKATSFSDKAKKAGFTSAETKGGAALMTRKDRGYKAGGSVKSSASKRADGCAVRGKTRGRMV
jgi:hypothetical protein